MLSESPYRSLFPSASRRIHLDHAGVAPISQRVVDAIELFAREAAERLSERYPYWNARAEEVRALKVKDSLVRQFCKSCGPHLLSHPLALRSSG